VQFNDQTTLSIDSIPKKTGFDLLTYSTQIQKSTLYSLDVGLA